MFDRRRSSPLSDWVSSLFDQTRDQASNFGLAARQESSEIRDAASRFMNEVASIASRRGREFSSDAARNVDNFSQYVQSATSHLPDDALQFAKRRLRRNPVETLLVVAAAGIVIGWLGSRSKSSDNSSS